jgi:hypothetical protein
MAWRTSGSYRITRWMGVLIALALVALPMVPAQAGVKTFSWNTRPVKFMKDGTAYFMTMAVTESGGPSPSASIGVNISKSRNPSGVRRSTQFHSWSFSIDPASVDFNPNNLSTASVDTGTQLGDFGSIDLNFSQTAPLQRSCRGHIKTRAGRVTGTFNFDTQTDFGSVTKRPARGSLFHHDGANCGGGGGGGGNRCPAQSRSTSGSRFSPDFMSLNASRRNGASSASVSVSTFESFADPSGSAFHSISATVPGGNVVVANNLGSATVTGAGGTWISGTAEFTATGGRTSGAPTNCRDGKEWLIQSRPGTTTGDLVGDFFIGSDITLSDGDLTGSASKVVVRNR